MRSESRIIRAPGYSRGNTIIWKLALLILIASGAFARLCSLQAAFAVPIEPAHAVSGVVKSVDTATKTAVIDAGEGVEVAVKYTAKTVVTGATTSAKAVDVATLKGTHVVVHYTVAGAEKTASSIKYFAKNDVVKAAKGTVVGVDKAAGTVAIAAEDGAVTTYKLSKDAAVETETGAVQGAKYASKGGKVVVHYTEDGTEKTVHYIKHL